MAIVVATGSIALLSLPSWLESYRIRQTTVDLMGAIREAQIQAVKQNRGWRVLLDSDGRGYSLQQYQSTGQGPSDCGSTEWTSVRHASFHPTQAVEMSTASRTCFDFAPSGRANWPNPRAILGAGLTDTPSFPNTAGIVRLTDGVELYRGDPLPSDPRASTDTHNVSWYGINPVVVIDVGEVRQFRDVCIGLYAKPGGVVNARYPSTIVVDASATADAAGQPVAPWTRLLASSGPSNPPNGTPDVACVNIPVNGVYRFFKLSLTRSGSAPVVMYELRSTDNEFTIKGPKLSRRLVISPVTGRVSIQ